MHSHLSLSTLVNPSILTTGFLALSLILFPINVQKHSPDDNTARLSQVFSDFVFVGSGPHDPKKVPKHTMEELSAPGEFKRGHQYIFHHQKLGETDDIYNTLLQNLQSQGLKIVLSDASIYRYVGGPAFRIEFEGNGFKGHIFNSMDGQIINNNSLVKKWDIDDYVLILEGK